MILEDSTIKAIKTANQSWKIEESFRETSEVSTTLLGINRAETQLSLFSNVSSYGLEKDSFEFYSFNGGNNFASWDTRQNKTYGSRYNARLSEEVEESGLRLEAFPTPFSYPFGPKFARWDFIVRTFQRYKDFITLGNTIIHLFRQWCWCSSRLPIRLERQILRSSIGGSGRN